MFLIETDFFSIWKCWFVRFETFQCKFQLHFLLGWGWYFWLNDETSPCLPIMSQHCQMAQNQPKISLAMRAGASVCLIQMRVLSLDHLGIKWPSAFCPQSFLLKLFNFLRYNWILIEWRNTDTGTQERQRKNWIDFFFLLPQILLTPAPVTTLGHTALAWTPLYLKKKIWFRCSLSFIYLVMWHHSTDWRHKWGCVDLSHPRGWHLWVDINSNLLRPSRDFGGFVRSRHKCQHEIHQEYKSSQVAEWDSNKNKENVKDERLTSSEKNYKSCIARKLLVRDMPVPVYLKHETPASKKIIWRWKICENFFLLTAQSKCIIPTQMNCIETEETNKIQDS